MVKNKNLTRDMKKQVGEILSMQYINDVIVCGFDKKKKRLVSGCHYDPKAKSGYTRGTNGVPLLLVDNKAEGICHIIAYASPGHYHDIIQQLDNYVVSTPEKNVYKKNNIYLDTEIHMHIENIESLVDDVVKVHKGSPLELENAYSSGVYNVQRVKGHIKCLVVGCVPKIGLKPMIIPVIGKEKDVEYILNNYHEYFGI